VARPTRAGEVMPRGAVLLSGEVTGRVVAGPRNLAAALDAAVHTALVRLAAARREPAPGTWDDAAVRGLFTAALAFASFALVTHVWLGEGPLGPPALFSTAAVLAGVSPAAILAAAPAARAVAVLRARAAGIVVKDAGALEALARVDTVCFARSAASAGARAVHGLRDRGIRALMIRSDHPEAIRDLQLAGARVLLVVEDGHRDPGGAAQADVAVAVAAAVATGTLPGASHAPIVLAEGHLDDLVGLVDLGRAVCAVIRENAVLGAVYNAAILPAAALGYVSPRNAAGLVLAETLLALANAARLLYRPSLEARAR
jgi:cation transport ATPase